MERRQRADAPIAVGRVDDEDLLGAFVPPHPQLHEVQAPLDPLAHPEADVVLPPEIGEGEAREPHLDILVDRDLARRRNGRGFGRDVLAGGPVRLATVLPQAADIGRMIGLDAEGSHLGRGEIDRDIVLFGAKDRFARIGDVDREPVEGRGCGSGDEAGERESREEHRRKTHESILDQFRTA